MYIDTNKLKIQLRDFLETKKTVLEEFYDNANHIFEAVCVVIVAQHYQRQKYVVIPTNLINGKFRFKFTTSGHPMHYSYFVVKRGLEENSEILCEIHHNLTVQSAWDDGSGKHLALFAADVAVIRPNALPPYPQKKNRKQTKQGKFTGLPNSDLITFGEAKKLVAYPMLLAQFVGEVNEIKPVFLKARLPKNFRREGHPKPILFVANHLTAGSSGVIESFKKRKFNIFILENVNSEPILKLVERILDKKPRGGTYSKTVPK